MERFLTITPKTKAKAKVYAVAAGRKPGLYETWEEARDQVASFPGAMFKGFPTLEEAEAYMVTTIVEPIGEMVTTATGLAELNTEQKAAFDAVISGESIFITGPGGTGKSFLLQTLYANYKGYSGGKKLCVTAMTGCAALLLGSWAKTLHSWAGIGLGRSPVDSIVSTILVDKHKKKRWLQTDCLVIDEVSMLTPALLEYLDAVGRRIRKKEEPFGGIQLVLVGDFYQLPPVSQDRARTFAFESPLWGLVIKRTIQLTQILRQKDPAFQQILNEARTGDLTPESYEILEGCKNMAWKRQEIKPTLLFTKNQDVQSINSHQLEKLGGEIHTFTAKTTHIPRGIQESALKMIVEKLDRDAPYEVELNIKERCQVMLLQQQYEERKTTDDKGKVRTVRTAISGLVNGSRGVVVGFDSDGNPKVKFMNEQCITIRPGKWTSDAENENDGVTREQIPLRLAYALTIHKAQGASLDSALIDVGPSTFEYGQAYVALSRVRSLESLFIYEISPRAFRAHPLVKKFYEDL
jgi:ATP-dependent DNA helicase PIF1